MMPLLYALIKSTKGNATEGHKLIQEGRSIVKALEKLKENDDRIKKSPPRSESKSPGSPTPLSSNDGNDEPLDLRCTFKQDLAQSKISNHEKTNCLKKIESHSSSCCMESTSQIALFKPYENKNDSSNQSSPNTQNYDQFCSAETSRNYQITDSQKTRTCNHSFSGHSNLPNFSTDNNKPLGPTNYKEFRPTGIVKPQKSETAESLREKYCEKTSLS
jgi:hypothetical protein